MRFSELTNREIINTFDGSRLGLLGDSDLVINSRTRKILSLVLFKRGLLGLARGRSESILSWTAVKKIGQDMIILDIGKKGL